ncbi:hypothetical protein VTJ49DRAFT_7428 [Mycothermus thermophilus]|uniref:Uncharacterized protein n=1 Tax=Humicola insolens TaxID=85995 RepID=A0ABR3VHT1_HUMIN
MDSATKNAPLPFQLDDSIDNALLAVSQTGAALGLITVIIVAVAYALIRRLRSQVATLVVLVGISNAIGSIAVLVTHGDVHHGDLSLWYQAQGFLFDIFALSSASWAVIFSVHTLIIFIRGPRRKYLGKWGWIYSAICFIPPFAIAIGHTKFKKEKYAQSRWMYEELSQEELEQKIREVVPFQLYIGIWGCILASLIVYSVVGVMILRERIIHNAKQQEELRDAEKGKKNSILSLSGWPVSPRCLSIFLDSQRNSTTTTDTDHDHDHDKPSRPLSYPPAALLPDSAPEPTWLTTFATSPRSAPSPPEQLPTSDPRRRVYLRTGLILTLSLIITWIPGTSNLTWRGLHTDQDSPVPLLAVNAVVFNIHGVWIGVMFFWGVGGWRDVKDVWVSGGLRAGRVVEWWRERRRGNKGKAVDRFTWEGEAVQEEGLSPSYGYSPGYPAVPPRVHRGPVSWGTHTYAEPEYVEEPKELDSAQLAASLASEGWDFVDRGMPRERSPVDRGPWGPTSPVIPTCPPPGYI